MKTEINFKPWIGEKYLSEGFKGKRIIVLGESHYCPKELAEGGRCFPFCKKENMKKECVSQTEDIIGDFVGGYNGESYMQTYLCFERAIYGKELSQEERAYFWDRIIYYNYVQYALPAARTAPTSDQWSKSESAFKEMLEKYMPDYIIVWGARLYKALPALDGVGSDFSINENDKTEVWTYTINGKKIPAMKVYHPSSPIGKSWPYWHQFYVKFLGL